MEKIVHVPNTFFEGASTMQLYSLKTCWKDMARKLVIIILTFPIQWTSSKDCRLLSLLAHLIKTWVSATVRISSIPKCLAKKRMLHIPKISSCVIMPLPTLIQPFISTMGPSLRYIPSPHIPSYSAPSKYPTAEPALMEGNKKDLGSLNTFFFIHSEYAPIVLEITKLWSHTLS